MKRYSKALTSILIATSASLPLISMAQDQPDAFEAMDSLLDQQFADFDQGIDEQFERVNLAIQRAYEGLTQKIEVNWEEDIKLPTQTSWVTYDQAMQSRVEVDFNQGIYVAEVLVQQNNVESSIAKLASLMSDLQQARDEELNKRDAFLNELEQELNKENILSEESAVSNTPEKPPLLETVVELPDEKTLNAIIVAETKAAVESTMTISPTPPQETPTPKTIPTKKTSIAAAPSISLEKNAAGEVKKVRVEIKFVNNYQEKILSRYLEDIERISKDFDVEVSTMLAIMETESSFNPRATSPIPAFGLMQVVPRTAGIDAYRHVYGEKKVVTADFLYDELNNILMGTAYFNLLTSRYLRNIDNGQSRFYCAVASYNTGVGNLAKTFTGTKNIKTAAKEINKMSPQEVYDFLIQELPAEETRNYLKKIVRRADKYKVFDKGMI